MRKSRYSEEQIAMAPRQVEVGAPVAEVCRKMQVAKSTFFRWKKMYAGLGIAELRRRKQLEVENRKLKQLVADLSLDQTILQEGLTLKGVRPKRRKSAVRREGRPTTTAANQRWAMDFIHDTLADGRTVRILSVLNVHTGGAWRSRRGRASGARTWGRC